MALIDLDKFVASFITEMKECSQMRNFSIPRCIKKALEDQCLEYKDSKIVKSQRRIAKKQLEQTVMDYEKAFKEAYERASLRFGTNVANELFLEYKESKEERTRRKLIEFFSDWSKTKSHCWGIRVTDIIDWLEKQGQKPAWTEADENGLGDALWCCKQAASTAKDENDMGDAWYAEQWLKSLKNRIKEE